MSPTGPKYPTAASDSGSSSSGDNNAWSPTSAVFAADNTYAIASVPGGGDSTNALFTSGYGLAIPSTALIDGIVVEFARYGSNMATENVSLGTVGSPLALKTGIDFWPTTSGWTSYGGPADTWGRSWTPAELNASGFGIGISAQNTHGGGTALIDAIRITVYWRVAPADVPKRYLYKSFSHGLYIGLLPNVTSKFNVVHDINTTGSQITIECAVSADVSSLPTEALTDESSNVLTDENGNTLTTESAQAVVALGDSGETAVIKNGNGLQVWEYSYYYPNGKCMFNGEIEHWEAGFGGGDNVETIRILAYSDGQDLEDYEIRGYPYTYTQDQATGSWDTIATISEDAIGNSWRRQGQTITPGVGVTNVGAIYLGLSGTANVTVSAYSDTTMTTLLGSVRQYVSVGGATGVTFAFPTIVPVTPGSPYFITVTVDLGQSIGICYLATGTYADGSRYEASYAGGSGGGSYSLTSGDLHVVTYSGTGSTTGTFSNADPTTGMVVPFMADYNARGGLISCNSSNIQATGLSLTYEFNTNTTNEGLRAALSMAPNGFYYYVDLGLNTLVMKSASTTADITVIKGRHIDRLTFVATIEGVKNKIDFMGGDVGGGVNLYRTYEDADSIYNYRLRLDRKADNRVTVGATADAIGNSSKEEQKGEAYQTSVTILASTMDITLLKPGLVLGFAGFGSFIDGMLLQIARVAYTPEEATLTVGRLPKRLSSELDKVTRSLIAQQTLANPATPS